MISLGIDPGTFAWDFTAVDEEGKIVLEKTFSTEIVKKSIDPVEDLLSDLKPRIVSAPSGYGMPLKRIRDLTEEDLFYLTLKKSSEPDGIGLRSVLKYLMNSGAEGYVLPAVKHLPTVPLHRKINRVDLGTPDKLCAAASILSSYERYVDASFVLAEIGYGFNAFVRVEKGRITDGIGGTMASSGFSAAGFMDAELFRILGPGTDPLGGGAKYIAGISDMASLFSAGSTDRIKDACEYFMEGVAKDLSRIATPNIPVFLSGRIGAYEAFAGRIKAMRPEFDIKGFKTNGASNSSFGAALIANGLAGGKYLPLVEHMRIGESRGSIMDLLYYDPRTAK